MISKYIMSTIIGRILSTLKGGKKWLIVLVAGVALVFADVLNVDSAVEFADSVLAIACSGE